MPKELESKVHRLLRDMGILSHAQFQRVYNEALRMLQNMREGRVFVLVGPSRAGKSEVVNALISALSSGIKSKHEGDIPILRIEADLSDRQRMSLLEFTVEALNKLRHPVFTGMYDLAETAGRPRLQIPERVLRPMLIKALEARGTLYLVIDAAHHLLHTQRDQLQSDVLDSLKNICNKAGVILVLFGGYQLLDGLLRSAHFNGRVDLAHFPQYKVTGEGLLEYASILKTFQEFLPLSEPELLIDHIAEIHKWGWGTFGATMDLLLAAESKRTSSKDNVLDMSHITRAALIDVGRDVVIQDILDGEAFFAKVSVYDQKDSGALCGDKARGGVVETRNAPIGAFKKKPRRTQAPTFRMK